MPRSLSEPSIARPSPRATRGRRVGNRGATRTSQSEPRQRGLYGGSAERGKARPTSFSRRESGNSHQLHAAGDERAGSRPVRADDPPEIMPSIA